MDEPLKLFYRTPIADDVDAAITTNFGDWLDRNGNLVAPFTPGAYQHRGTDFGVYRVTIVSPAKRPLLAVAPFNDGSFGTAVCLAHGDGWYSLYAHLERAFVEPGDWVAPGSAIGVSGNTGRGTGYHLHWQVSANTYFPLDIAYSRDPMSLISEDDMLNADDKEWIEKQIASAVEQGVARVMDAYSGTFRQLLRLYFVDGDPGDYADSNGKPIPADPDVLAVIAKLKAGALT